MDENQQEIEDALANIGVNIFPINVSGRVMYYFSRIEDNGDGQNYSTFLDAAEAAVDYYDQSFEEDDMEEPDDTWDDNGFDEDVF